jgi:drug/metabolite transporter (DMT)-like permease
MKPPNVIRSLLGAFKTGNVMRGLLCAALGGVLFAIAYTLVGGFKRETFFASSLGYGIFLLGCWKLAEAMLPPWLFPSGAKKKQEIDPYTTALVELELERKTKAPGR